MARRLWNRIILGLVIFCLSANGGVAVPPANRRALLGYSDHSYQLHGKVPLYANKVGPYHNPRLVRIPQVNPLVGFHPFQQSCCSVPHPHALPRPCLVPWQ